MENDIVPIYIREFEYSSPPAVILRVRRHEPLSFDALTSACPGASGLWYHPEGGDQPVVLYVDNESCGPPAGGGWSGSHDYYCFYSDPLEDEIHSRGLLDLLAFDVHVSLSLPILLEYLVLESGCNVAFLSQLKTAGTGPSKYFVFRCSSLEGQRRVTFRSHQVFPFDGLPFRVRPCVTTDVRGFGLCDCLRFPALDERKIAQTLSFFDSQNVAVAECYKISDGYFIFFRDARSALYYARGTLRLEEDREVGLLLHRRVDERLRKHLARLQSSPLNTYLFKLRTSILRNDFLVNPHLTALATRSKYVA